MRKLTDDYMENVDLLDKELNVSGNFDMLKKKLKVGDDDITLYYIDGFVKDTVMQKLMMYFLSVCQDRSVACVMAKTRCSMKVSKTKTRVSSATVSA